MPHTTMTDASIPPITEDDIAHYLANTPDFFERHAGLLAAVQLTSPHSHRAISLQERQAELLREKIRGLELKAAEMIRHGHENTAIADRLQRWTRQLLLSRTPAELLAAVTGGIAAQFDVPQVVVRLWGVAPDFAGLPEAQAVSEDVQAFAASLSQPYCGANPGLEVGHWLPDPASSLALMALRAAADQPVFGLLVLASPQVQRFTPDMGTDFLERIGALGAAALSRLLPA
ncbi:MAG: DUF484 family protein [Hydrogenophaga sp.]